MSAAQPGKEFAEAPLWKRSAEMRETPLTRFGNATLANLKDYPKNDRTTDIFQTGANRPRYYCFSCGVVGYAHMGIDDVGDW